MNILVLTSAMANKDFVSYVSRAKIKPNPSNQNFYNKLINCLAISNRVYAFSLRPFTRFMFDEDELSSSLSSEGTVTYYYPTQKVGKKYKAFEETKSLYNQVTKYIEDSNLTDYIVIVDTLRLPLLRIANKLKSKMKCKVVGVVTDNPLNLSNPDPTYANLVRKYSRGFDGYICLSESLNRLFNPIKRKSYIVEGLVEELDIKRKLPLGEYIFFGGSLYERYGVKRMLDAFHKSKCPYNFVIAGRGDLYRYITDLSDKDERLLFLSLLDKDTIYELESGAYININPRPYDMRLDRESVPSKLLEYFASGAPVVSTNHTKLKELFLNDAIWLDDDSAGNFEKFFNRLEDYPKHELERRATTARLKVYQYYGLRVQSQKITNYLESISSSSIADTI